jgi:Ca2+-binding RTX toxin-like protein
MGTPNPEIINGLAGDDKLNGNGGDDTLIGLSGNDTLLGRDGDDVYIINSNGDIINESLHEGTDWVQSFITYTLTANVEKLTLKGTRAINGTGNIIDNSIIGNNSNNVIKGEDGFDNLKGARGDDNLHGGEGNDTLKGGIGNDTLNGSVGQDVLTGSNDVDIFSFQFGESVVDLGQIDRITDFAIGTDKIDLLDVGMPNKLSRASNNNATSLLTVINDVFNDANESSGQQPLGLNSASVVVATNSSIAGTYLIVNDSNASFSPDNDLVINITGYSIIPFLGNTLPDIEIANNNIQPDLFFI